MTCKHVIDMIDAGPFVDHSRPHLEWARGHIRRCEHCAAAFQQSEALIARLEAIPSPAPSRDLTPNVMARIAALDVPVAQPATLRDQVAAGVVRGSRWALAAGALAAVAATMIVTASVSTSGDVQMPSVAGFRMGPFAMPGSSQELLAGAVSAMLYAFGLFVSDRFTDGQRALPRRHGDTDGLSGSS